MKSILLVEDNPDDVVLTLRALKKNNILNEVVVARDGVEALDYLFGTGVYAGRNTDVLPIVVLLDLKLPKMDGLEVLQRLRSDERTTADAGRYPHLVKRREGPDQRLQLRAPTAMSVKPVDFNQFSEAVRQLGLYWLLWNEPPPSPNNRCGA